MRTAVVLAGGKGIRLHPSTEDLPKPMMRIAGKPILERIVLMLKSLGFERLFIVVGYKKELIEGYFGEGKEFGVDISYLENKFIDNSRKCGLSDAVLLFEGIIHEPFLTILGDEIYAGTNHAAMLKAFEETLPACECMVGVIATEDPGAVKKNYSVKVGADWGISDLVEKPETPFNNLIGCGTYIFRPSVFEYIRKTPPNERSCRKELADTMKMMVNDGRAVKAFPLGGGYMNINYQRDLEEAEALLRRSR